MWKAGYMIVAADRAGAALLRQYAPAQNNDVQ